MSSAGSCHVMVPLEIGNCWWLHTADTNDSPWNAFGFTAISMFSINYQLPHWVIIVPGLQMTEAESTAVRTTGMAGWRLGHESSWCLQRPRNFGHLISQKSFLYYSIPFISLMDTLSKQNLHCCCSSESSSSQDTALCKLQHPTASENSHEPLVIYTQYSATQKAFYHLYLNLPLTSYYLNFQTCKYRKRGR